MEAEELTENGKYKLEKIQGFKKKHNNVVQIIINLPLKLAGTDDQADDSDCQAGPKCIFCVQQRLNCCQLQIIVSNRSIGMHKIQVRHSNSFKYNTFGAITCKPFGGVKITDEVNISIDSSRNHFNRWEMYLFYHKTYKDLNIKMLENMFIVFLLFIEQFLRVWNNHRLWWQPSSVYPLILNHQENGRWTVGLGVHDEEVGAQTQMRIHRKIL